MAGRFFFFITTHSPSRSSQIHRTSVKANGNTHSRALLHLCLTFNVKFSSEMDLFSVLVCHEGMLNTRPAQMHVN